MRPVETDVSLLNYNTFGIDCRAKRFAVVECVADLEALASEGYLAFSEFKVIGQGSNLVFGDTYEGTAVVMRNTGIQVVGENDGYVLVEVAAGEVWDRFVKHAIGMGWFGIENLVAIPGTVGAAAVQNIGAYGVEAKDAIESVRVFDVENRRIESFAAGECAYGYRDSMFKHVGRGRYIVVSVVFSLAKRFSPVLTYNALAEAISGMQNLDAATVARAIEDIRWSKLPKPEILGSAGSFFKNPLVPTEKYEELKGEYPDMSAHTAEGGYKLAAGWLIDKCGWKGRTLGRCGVYEKQALVLVNRGGCTGEEVRALSEAIVGDVERKFGVALECEAEFVGLEPPVCGKGQTTSETPA